MTEQGLNIVAENVTLPLEPHVSAFKVIAPDGIEIVIVERKDKDFDGCVYSIDHVQFLVSDAAESAKFFKGIFNGTLIEQDVDQPTTMNSAAIKVADALIVVSEAAALGMDAKEVSAIGCDGPFRLGIDHLGF